MGRVAPWQPPVQPVPLISLMEAQTLIYGYARVSTQDQDTTIQIKALLDAGCNCIVSEKRSGKDNDREQLQTILHMLKNGDELVVYRIDRLARSLSHLSSIIDHLCKVGATLRSLTEPINNETIAGRALLGILGVFAQMERELIRERTQAGLRDARARGVILGRRARYTKEDEARARELYRDGLNIKQICELTNASRPTVKKALFGSIFTPKAGEPNFHLLRQSDKK